MGRKGQHSEFDLQPRSISRPNSNYNKRSRRDSVSVRSFDSYDSVLSKHGCTDILCTLLFLVFISVLVGVSIFAYKNGNPSDLVLPHDSEGRVCGKTEGYADKPYLFFFDLTRCISVTTVIKGCSTKQICVKECPQENAYKKIPSQVDVINKFCDPANPTDCPDYLLSSGPVFQRCVPKILSDFVNNDDNTTVTVKDDSGHTIPIEINTGSGKTVLTYKTLEKGIEYLSKLLEAKKFFEMAYQDLSSTVWIILLGLVLGAVIAFLWMFVLRFIIKPMIYITILIVLVLLGFGTYYCFQQFLSIKNGHNADNSLAFDFSRIYDLNYLSRLQETWLITSIVQGVIFIVLLLVVIFIRKRINMAAELIKEVSKAIVLIPASLVWPFLPFLLEIGIIVYCCSTALYLASSGVRLFQVVDTNLTNSSANFSQEYFSTFLMYREEPMDQVKSLNYTPPVSFKLGSYCDPKSFAVSKAAMLKNGSSEVEFLECYFFKFGYDPDLGIDIGPEVINEYYTIVVTFINNYQWIPQFYVIFMLFWLTAFMMGLNEMTLAGSFGAWYWTRFQNLSPGLQNRLPFFTVLGSLGRALFYHMGTIAFGSLLIAIVKIIRVILEFLSRKLKPKVESSKIAKYLVCCLKCCFWCLERFIKFINRYAFIITAVYSLNFCSAAGKAFKLITSNVLRVLVIDRITGFIMLLSNVAITSIVSILAYLFFSKRLPIDGLLTLAPDLNYYFVPVFVIIVGCFTITKLFFDVFSMGVDTLLICVLIDVDMNDGSKARPYFMSKNLRKILKISNKRYEDE